MFQSTIWKTLIQNRIGIVRFIVRSYSTYELFLQETSDAYVPMLYISSLDLYENIQELLSPLFLPRIIMIRENISFLYLITSR